MMGIDYVLALPCQVKESLTEKGMVELIKNRNRAHAMIEKNHQSGEEKSPSEITFITRLLTPEGVVDKEICVQDLLDEVAQIEPLGHYCSQCPANMLRQPFGCYGYISYPLETASEQWLMTLLPADVNSIAGEFLQKAVKDFEYTGDAVSQMRKQGPTFFESRKSETRRWGNIVSGWKIASDQLFEMMFCVGNIQPIHAALIACFCGIIPHDLDPSQCITIMQNLEMLAEVAEPHGWEPIEIKSQIDEFKLFLLSLKTAASLNLEISIDI